MPSGSSGRNRGISQTAGYRRELKYVLLFLSPGLLGISVFFLAPFADTIRRSFYDARGKNFIGFDGYVSVVNNEAFQLAAANTARFVAVCIPLLIGVSLAAALMLRAVRPRGRIFKTTLLLPLSVPVAGVALIWQALFAPRGLMNTALASLGASPIDFLGSSAAFWVLVFTYLWKNLGYDMVLLLAGLDGISINLYEAARVDGANGWQLFRYITLPGLLPALGVATILSLLNSFKVFREAYLVSGAYPHDSVYLLQHLFNNWFYELDITRISAAAVLLALTLFGLIAFLRRIMRGEARA